MPETSNRLVRVLSAAVNGLETTPVQIEISTSTGKDFFMVGLPDSAVRESRTRVQSALRNTGFRLALRNTVVNFAPADVRKEGTAYDLPLALGLLGAYDYVQTERFGRYMFMGELGLDGSLRPVRGALPIAIMARRAGYEGLIVPHQNVREAGVVDRLAVYGATTLTEVVAFLNGRDSLRPVEVDTRGEFYARQQDCPVDFADVRGQENVKRALEVAAAGGHNILLVGSPGCGKSMMAKRLPSILPPLTLAESLETTQIHSIAGRLPEGTSSLPNAPSARLTTPSQTWPSSAGEAISSPEKSAWPTTGSSSSTSCLSSAVRPSKRCDSPLKTARSLSHGPSTTSRCPAHSCLWRR